MSVVEQNALYQAVSGDIGEASQSAQVVRGQAGAGLDLDADDFSSLILDHKACFVLITIPIPGKTIRSVCVRGVLAQLAGRVENKSRQIGKVYPANWESVVPPPYFLTLQARCASLQRTGEASPCFVHIDLDTFFRVFGIMFVQFTSCPDR